MAAGIAGPHHDATLADLGAVLVRPDGYVAAAQTRGLAEELPTAALARWLKAPPPMVRKAGQRITV